MPRRNLSPAMRDHRPVLGLEQRLGNREHHPDGRMQFQAGATPPFGFLNADTVEENGFSLRIRKQAGNGTLSVMAITNLFGRRHYLEFPPAARLRQHLPDHETQIAEFVEVVHRHIGLNLEEFGERQRPIRPLNNRLLESTLAALDEFCPLLLALANRP